MTGLYITILALLALIGLPIFTVIGGIALLLLHSIGQDIGLMMGDTYKIAVMPGLLAVPLFVFTGYLLAETKISERLLRFLSAIMGWLPGGVAIAAMATMGIFTAFTGITIVTIVAFAGILLPLLTKELGYSEEFSFGFITSTGLLGVLLPPCIVVVLYGLIAEINIRGLYIAGVLPVLLCFFAFSVYLAIYSIIKGAPRAPFSLRELCESFWAIKWEAPSAILVLVGIFGGFFTVNDAAAVMTIYFLFVEIFILKEVKLRQLPRIVEECMVMLGSIFIILGVALSFANFLIYQEVPMRLFEWIRVMITSRLTFLIMLNLFLFIVGMLLDLFTAIMVVVPLVLPIARYYNVDPYHLGIIFLMNLEMGHLTPPVGINLFASAMRFHQPMLRICRSVIPFLIIFVMCLAIVTYWPAISTWLVGVFNIRGQITF